MQAPRWEYYSLHLDVGGLINPKVDTDEVAQRLNELGNVGWELVSTSDLNAGQGKTRGLLAIFKRPAN